MSDLSKDNAIGNSESDDLLSARAQPPDDLSPVTSDALDDSEADGEASSSTSTLLSHLTGQVIDHYQIGVRVGGGAFSAVYRATDLRNGGILALKVLLPGADDVARRRFRLEAKTAANLDHPHIVKTFQVGDRAIHDVAYIVMELVEGESLADLLERFRQLSVVDAAKVLEPIARALDYAHELGIVHRDVKPSNILLRPVDEPTPQSVQLSILERPVIPLLSDFGIARALDAPELTSTGRTIGTPAYMAPEQCAGNSQISGQADIYALGTVLYRCLVGRPPFVGTTTQILYAHVYGPLTIPDSILVNLPPYVITVLQRSLAKDVEGRYYSAGQMSTDLSRAAGISAGSPDVSDVNYQASTVTMASLPTASEPPTGSQSSVLVPAAAPSGARSIPLVAPRRESTTTGNRAVRRPAKTPAGSGRYSGRNRRWVGLGIGLALVVVVAVSGSILLRRSLPAIVSTATPALAELPQPTPTDVSTPATAAASGIVGEQDSGEPEAQATLSPAETITIPAMSAVTVPSAWRDAKFLYEDRDWQAALDQLTLILRTDSIFNQILGEARGELAGPIAANFAERIQDPSWDEWDDDLSTDEMLEMLFEIFVGLGTKENASNRQLTALEMFDAALLLQPDSEEVAELRAATAQFVQAHPGDRPEARQNLHLAHSQLSRSLASQGLFCAAAEQQGAALAISPDSQAQAQGRLLEYERRCAMDVDAAVAVIEGDVLEGNVLYSTVDDGNYRIFRIPAEFNPSGHLLVENATQPALSPQGSLLALYSTRSDLEGLAGFDVNAGLDPNERSIRFTPRFVEDARESPPSWNPEGNRLVFASTREGDKRSRIYVTWADGKDNTTSIAFGKDPAWHPQLDLIVFNGRDLTGNNPGLWLINVDGSGLRRLTTAEDDIRPVWTPDGRHVIFMNRSRSGNWDVYRVNVEDGAVSAMTESPFRDGLPTISPDGEHIAFVSDRDGIQRIWIRPWLDGEAERLALILGSQNDWLEHSIQWTE